MPDRNRGGSPRRAADGKFTSNQGGRSGSSRSSSSGRSSASRGEATRSAGSRSGGGTRGGNARTPQRGGSSEQHSRAGRQSHRNG